MRPDLLESVYGWQIRRCEDETGFISEAERQQAV